MTTPAGPHRAAPLRRRRPWWIAALVLVALVGVGVLLYFTLIKDDDGGELGSPSAVVEEYWAAAQGRDVARIEDLSTGQMKLVLEAADADEVLPDEVVKKVEVTDEEVSGSQATVKVTATLEDGDGVRQHDVAFDLKDVDGEWKISDIDE